MNRKNDRSLDELYYDLSIAEPTERGEVLDQLVRAYPERASELNEFAVELAFDTAKHANISTEPVDDSDPVVMRAMSKLQNRLFELEHEQKQDASASSAEAPANPFAPMSREQFRAAASALGANLRFTMRLRDRGIRPDTISPGFRRHAAGKLGVSEAVLSAHLAGQPEVRLDSRFKSQQKPQAAVQETFQEAVANSGLTREQQDYLLSL